MSLDEDIRRLAVNEVLSPTAELTKQYLHTNKLMYEDGKPVIEDVIISDNRASAEVYSLF